MRGKSEENNEKRKYAKKNMKVYKVYLRRGIVPLSTTHNNELLLVQCCQKADAAHTHTVSEARVHVRRVFYLATLPQSTLEKKTIWPIPRFGIAAFIYVCNKTRTRASMTSLLFLDCTERFLERFLLVFQRFNSL